MGEIFASAPMLLASIVVGYFLGALPLADQISRRHGVDIFSSGTGLAGATNVRRSVGRFPAALVLIGDVGKGALTILVAKAFGVESPWYLLPVAAAIVGHWKSVFSGFRGGDGLVTLGGSAIAMFPSVGLVSVTVASLVGLTLQKLPYTSLLSIVFGYATLGALTVALDGDKVLAVGFGGLSGLVLSYALLGHRRRRNAAEWDDLDNGNEAAETSGTQ